MLGLALHGSCFVRQPIKQGFGSRPLVCYLRERDCRERWLCRVQQQRVFLCVCVCVCTFGRAVCASVREGVAVLWERARE